MIHDKIKNRGTRSRTTGNISIRVRELAEAGAKGAALTSVQIKEICEALHAQVHSVRNQFHSGM